MVVIEVVSGEILGSSKRALRLFITAHSLVSMTLTTKFVPLIPIPAQECLPNSYPRLPDHPEPHQKSRVKLPLLQTTPMTILWGPTRSSHLDIGILGIGLSSSSTDLLVFLEVGFLAVSGAVLHALAFGAGLQWFLWVGPDFTAVCALLLESGGF